ncbi:MAG: hypothetical protein Q4F85_08120 [Prevotella sp.]|nr:hypothetical protein [Prevotella sp.]
MVSNVTTIFSEETFAAWLDGMLSPEDEKTFVEMCASDADMLEILDANDAVDYVYEDMVESGYDLPDDLLVDFDLPYVALSDSEYDDIPEYDDGSEQYVDGESDYNDTLDDVEAWF